MKRAIYALADLMARPAAFVALSSSALALAAAGFVLRLGEGYFAIVNLSISIVTLAIGQAVLVAAARDEKAVHVKLDRLIEAGAATNDVIGIEHQDADAIERLRKETEQRA